MSASHPDPLPLTPGRQPYGRTAASAILAAGLSLAVSAGFMFARPDLSRGAAFLFSDEAANLFVADALHHAQSLYTEVAFP